MLHCVHAGILLLACGEIFFSSSGHRHTQYSQIIDYLPEIFRGHSESSNSSHQNFSTA